MISILLEQRGHSEACYGRENHCERKPEMTRIALIGAAALLLTVPAFAQTSTTAPGGTMAPQSGVTPVPVQPGGPGAANSGPAATGTVAPGPTGAESRSNNSAGAGNAEQPTR